MTRAEINELLYQDLDQREIDAGLSRLFFINQTDDGLGPLALAEAETSGGRRYERLANLSVHRLHRLHRFVKLARHLDYSFHRARLGPALAAGIIPAGDGAAL